MGNRVKNNPLLSRADLEQAVVQLIEPLIPYLSQGKARLHLDETGATYCDAIAEMEGFARPLWAIIPMLASESRAIVPIWNIWREGIINGTDPAHPEYWGQIGSFDQRQVEMAVFGYGMAIAPKRFFFSLPAEAQTNLYRWLDQINRTELPNNNWTYFRVIVNAGFIACGLPHDEKRLEEDFATLEAHYLGDGWYWDRPGQIDYYIPWAFHYYGMIYARTMMHRDPERGMKLLERAKSIAPDIACWFDTSGEGLPYGRSMTYRFAQSAFFSALALADAECDALSYGQIKHLLLGNLRKWFQKPIFSRDGVLTIGYGYPSLLMSERYNAPGSPYWAMKAFACLALSEDHPFWQAEEMAYDAPAVIVQQHMRMLVTRSPDGSHVIAYPAGNSSAIHAHSEAKYEKFAYSTLFGFSVPKTMINLSGGAFDSMLALSEDNVHWHTRYQAKEYRISETCVYSAWAPMKDVSIQTEIYPHGEWHVRVHRIDTKRELQIAESGFAIARGAADEACSQLDPSRAMVRAPWGTSAIYPLRGYEDTQVMMPETNTNLMAPRTLLPMLRGKLEIGTHTLICAVLGTGEVVNTNVPQEALRPICDLLQCGKETEHVND